MPDDEGGVMFLDRTFAKECVRTHEGRALARDEQASARVAIEPVHELERLVRPQCPQRLDDAEGEPGSAVDGKARGLVQHEEPGIFVHDGVAHDGEQGVGNTRRPGLDRRRVAQRRQPDFVFGREPVVSLLALAVDPDLAAPQQAVDPAAGHALELAQQEIVEALAGRRLAGPDLAHANRLISTRHHRISLTC